MIVPELFNSEDLSNCYIIRSMVFGKDWKIYYLVWLYPETIVRRDANLDFSGFFYEKGLIRDIKSCLKEVLE